MGFYQFVDHRDDIVDRKLPAGMGIEHGGLIDMVSLFGARPPQW